MSEFPVTACASCGAPPVGRFGDGSPRYPRSCSHPPIRPTQAPTAPAKTKRSKA